MNRSLAAAVVTLASLAAFSCASSSSKPAPHVDLSQIRRLVATENGIRIDAEVHGETLSSNNSLPLNYTITNTRQTPIAIADLIPEGNFDPDTQIVTINLGSEVLGQELLPRLITINPGEKKDFSTSAHFSILLPQSAATPYTRVPTALQIKVTYLNDIKPFQQLIGLQEHALHDRALANELFPKWVEASESIMTNTLPMHWRTDDSLAPAAIRSHSN